MINIKKLQEIAEPVSKESVERAERRKKRREFTENGGWIYGGIFLDDEGKKTLDSLYGKNLPEGWKKYASHCTLAFNDCTRKSHFYYLWMLAFLKRRCTMKITHIGIDKNVIAFRVELEEGTVCKNKIPHITYAVSPAGKPVMSNYIENWIPINEEVYVEGTIKIITK